MDPLNEAYPLVAIVGPTASGKSALAVTLAEQFNGEVVNYDSVQIYRGFDIGTAKPDPRERRNIPHHLLDCINPEEAFTAGDYRRQAGQVLGEIRRRGKLPILVGGTGLYLRALLLGLFEGPGRSEALRFRLRAVAARRGCEFLHRWLERLDPLSAARIGLRDLPKTIRAIEVCLLSRQPLSALHARGREGLRGFHIIKLGFDPDRALLYERINRRVETMFASGLLEETRSMLARPDASYLKPLDALGYRQACAVIHGEISLEKAIHETQKATRRYAKRQMTWFRREAEVLWFRGFAADPEVQRRVVEELNGFFRMQNICAQVSGSRDVQPLEISVADPL